MNFKQKNQLTDFNFARIKFRRHCSVWILNDSRSMVQKTAKNTNFCGQFLQNIVVLPLKFSKRTYGEKVPRLNRRCKTPGLKYRVKNAGVIFSGFKSAGVARANAASANFETVASAMTRASNLKTENFKFYKSWQLF